MVRHLLSLKDYSAEEIEKILVKAMEIKKNPEQYYTALDKKTLIMLFQKTSTRTRLSFENGMTQLGGHAIFMDWRTTQFRIAEFVDEVKAATLFGDLLMFRPLKHESLEEAASASGIPVINALCEKYHPCQALADAMTMEEHGGLGGKNVVWLGIGDNVSNSLVNVCTKLGAKITMCISEQDKDSYDPGLVEQAKATGLYEETPDTSCLADADFVHTDTWINMEYFDQDGKVVPGFMAELERRKQAFMSFQLSKSLLEKHNCSAKIMHCMPCHIGYEITRDAIEHPNSIIFEQAENRLHVQKALMMFLLGKL